MARANIEGRAAALLTKHRVERPPVPVEEVAVAEGIQVIRSPAEGTESGFLLRDNDHILIGLNSRQHPRRQRFTIAHELGHLQLHQGRPLIVDHAVRINKRDKVSSAATDREEIEANAFAAALLMPEQLVRQAALREVQSGSGSRDSVVHELSVLFDVSPEAMGFRLINLAILGA